MTIYTFLEGVRATIPYLGIMESDRVADTDNRIASCISIAMETLAREHLLFRRKSTFTSSNSSILYSRFANLPVRIKSIKKDGRRVGFKELSGAIELPEDGVYEVDYFYSPRVIFISQTTFLSSTFRLPIKIDLRIIGLATACEFLRLTGGYERALILQEQLLEIMRQKNASTGGGRLPSPRWAI